MSPLRIFVAGSLLAVLGAALGQTQEQRVAVILVNYGGLKQVVAQQRGKVVLVDFWAGFCLPCMHKKYADQGFVLVTVSVDDPNDPEKVESANATLRLVNSPPLAKGGTGAPTPPLAKGGTGAPTPPLAKGGAGGVPVLNLLLNESAEIWSKTLDFKTIPCYYLFDRHGKWVRYGGDPDRDVDYDEMERTVVRLLNEK
jgi:thiol-disulfide isomerase/thioredoxin